MKYQRLQNYMRQNPRGYRFAQPNIGNVRPVDPVLTAFSIGFKNDRFLWDRIAPPFTTDEKSGTYFVYTRDFWLKRQPGAARGEDAPYQRVGYGVSTATFNTVEIGYEKVLGDPTRAASQTDVDLEELDTQFLTNAIQMEIEKRVANVMFVSGGWGTSNTLTGTDQWSDFANSDPITDAQTAIRTILRNTGARPNQLFIGLTGWEKLSEHPLVLDKYKHTQTGVMTPELVAPVMFGAGMEGEIIVGDSVENTADENQSFSGSDIWTDNALFSRVETPGSQTGNAATTFMWDERGNVPWAVEQYRDENIRADVQRVFSHLDPQITSAQHGYLFLDLVA